MRKLIILILIIISTIFGQRSLDSILTKVSTLDKPGKLKFLNQMCWNYRDNDPQMTITLGQLTLTLSDSFQINKYKSETLSFIGVAYRNMGQLNTAFNYFTKALELSTELNDSAQIGYAYDNISRVYVLKGDYSNAIENGFRTMTIFEKINNKRGLGYANLSLGRIYSDQRNYEKALEYLQRSADIRKDIKDTDAEATANFYIAQIYAFSGANDKALRIFHEVENTYKTNNNMRGITGTYAAIADIYYQERNFAEAMKYSNLAMSISESVHDMVGAISNKLNLGRIFREKGDFASAEKYFLDAVELSQRHEYSQSELESYNELWKLYTKKNDLVKTVEYLGKYNKLNEVIFGQKISNTIADLQTSYQMEKKDKENDILKNSLEEEGKRSFMLQIIIVLIVLLGTLIYSKFRVNIRANKLLKELNLTKDKYFRILAHELRNPFNSILGYSDYLKSEYKNLGEDEKVTILDNLNSTLKNVYFLLDNLLNWTASQVKEVKVNPESFPIRNVIDEVSDLFMNSARLKQITITNEVDANSHCFADKNMIRTVMRNLVSNSIKFTQEGGIISITGRETEGLTEITVADNGIGIDPKKIKDLFNSETHFSTIGTHNEKGSGLGLILVKEFVEQNGGKLTIECADQRGCKISFNLPMQ